MVKDYSDNKIKTRCCHYLGYSFQLAARDLLYAPPYRQDSTYHSLCNTSCGSLAGTRNSSMSLPWGIDPTTHCTMIRCSTTELHLTPKRQTEADTSQKPCAGVGRVNYQINSSFTLEFVFEVRNREHLF